jgi:CheY-like chemotaxis protein
VSLTSKTVLIVEDDAAARIMLETLFLAEGDFHVRTASEGGEALRSVAEATPDLIVLDLMLPWVNGLEVLSTLRQQPELPRIPVLVTTGTATTPFDLRGLGPLRVMRKPLDLDAVVPTARKLLDCQGSSS